MSYTHTRTEHRTYFIADCVLTRSIDNMCMRRRTGEGLINLVKCFHVVHGRSAHVQRDRGGADSCAFGRGGAGSMIFDFKLKGAFHVF